MLIFKRTNSNHKDFQQLVLELDKELAIRNGEMNDFFAQFNAINQLQHVVVAYDAGKPVGCGAIKEFAVDVVEIKRMYVPGHWRGKGIASGVLNELEKWALELGIIKCVLETGDDMAAAIALYKKNHYQIIPNYGQYKDVVHSVCFEKELK